jgi:EPS-associated MarR family transcriptional regulator
MPGTLSDESRYRILRLIEQHPAISQREIARELGISLGKVNFCLNALIEKGVLKANSFLNSRNKRAYVYVFTPSGIEEKARITLRFLKRKVGEFEALQKEIAELMEQARKLRAGGIEEEPELAAVAGPGSDARPTNPSTGIDRKPS